MMSEVGTRNLKGFNIFGFRKSYCDTTLNRITGYGYYSSSNLAHTINNFPGLTVVQATGVAGPARKCHLTEFTCGHVHTTFRGDMAVGKFALFPIFIVHWSAIKPLPGVIHEFSAKPQMLRNIFPERKRMKYFTLISGPFSGPLLAGLFLSMLQIKSSSSLLWTLASSPPSFWHFGRQMSMS